MAPDFQIIVGKTQRTEPHRGHNHKHHVDIAEISKEQTREQDGNDNDDSPHRGCALLFCLTLQPEIAHNLAHLHELQTIDYTPADYRGA